MTVPTNNEEAEALNLLKYAAGVDHPTFGQGFFFTQNAVDSLISDVRRPPVSGDTAEARAEAERRYPKRPFVTESHVQNSFVAGAEWQASQPREAAPSDSDRALKAERLRQLAASYRMDLKSPSTAAMLDDAADTLSRTSHPVQVEVTDDMVRRADAAYWKSANDCDDHADPMRDALVAALGGGE